MLTLSIIAVGRNRNGPVDELARLYGGRIRWQLTIHEIEVKASSSSRQNAEENERILKAIPDGAFVVILDERGKSLKSRAFAEKIREIRDSGIGPLVFVVGGNEGLSDAVRARADMMMSFGAQTWPHMLARTMLLEQIYRAQQILGGHPYHKE
ncbi:MAG: 23S rRNA (pseudouridine(1915)-N(3))-methyltransferase RlmH [Alphaproteobacteria bacterium]|nr:23S rRNA (pseudouridine(1915)-N(3))-methyltransferase RlmH [Alphaproteobacteria bacterium]